MRADASFLTFASLRRRVGVTETWKRYSLRQFVPMAAGS
jgi:hypothetical protein